MLKGVYITARYYYQYRLEQDNIILNAFVPVMAVILLNFLMFEMDEEINILLNTRFHTTQ